MRSGAGTRGSGQLLGIVDTLAMETDWEQLNPVNPTPGGDHQSYIIVGDTATVTLAQVQAATGFMGNAGPVPAYTGQKYLSFLRPEDEGAFRAIYLYAQGTPNTQNQIGAWSQQPNALTVGGVPHLILTSDGLLSPPVGYTLVLEVV